MRLMAEQIGVRYGTREILRDVSIEVRAGEVLALVGANGSGKTTLLRALSGVLPLSAGAVWIEDPPREARRSLLALPPRERAQRIGVVEQDMHLPFRFTVREVVSLGRLPHRARFAARTAADEAAVDRALAETGLEALAGRPIDTLSSGERQRAFIALALAQAPRILLLDEPIAHLDLRYQVEIIRLAQQLAAAGLSVLLTLHDLNLASFAHRVALLAGGRLLCTGAPAAVLLPQHIAEAYGTPVRILEVAPGEAADGAAAASAASAASAAPVRLVLPQALRPPGDPRTP